MSDFANEAELRELFSMEPGDNTFNDFIQTCDGRWEKGWRFVADEPKVEYKNNPTVVCVLLPRCDGRLILIRRGLADGYGKLALPGGFQNHGEDMHKAAAREVLEETGIEIDETALMLVSGGTDEYCHNVLFFLYPREIDMDQEFKPNDDGEILEVVPVIGPVETAYPMHTEAVKRYFTCR